MLVCAGWPARAQEEWRSEPWLNWKSEIAKDNALAGRIWSTAAWAFIDPGRLAEHLTKVRYTILGEVHDNPDHHRLQAWLIAAMAAADLEPTVVFEMIDPDRQQALTGFLEKYASAPKKNGPERLGKAVGWEAAGWPSWSIYQPIAEAALGARLLLAAGDVDSYHIRQIRKKGEAGLDKDDRWRLGLKAPLAPALAAALAEELKQSHCGLLPEAALGTMALIQRLRDASLADSMMRNAASSSAVLIAGNGHARTDRGVPLYLRARDPIGQTAVVMMLEVGKGDSKPEDLVPKDPSGMPAADYVWFTPTEARPDACEELKKQMSGTAVAPQ